MSPRALLRALGALAVLLFLWGAFALFRGSISDRATGLDLPALTAADVDRIVVQAGEDTIDLRRVGGGWQVNGRAADAGQIDQLFAALADSAASSELIARSEGSHGRLGVDGTGRRVRFQRGGDDLLVLVVGERGRDYQTAYLRLDASSDVFMYRGSLPGLLDRDMDAWRDRRIARVVPDSVGAVVVERGGRAARLSRAGEAWTVGGAPADSAAVGGLLRALGDVTAIGFPAAATEDSLDFERPSRRLTVLGRGGDTVLALAFDSTGTGHWARRGSDGTVFQLDFWRVNQLTPPDSALRAR